jgi:hypothetical protein
MEKSLTVPINNALQKKHPIELYNTSFIIAQNLVKSSKIDQEGFVLNAENRANAKVVISAMNTAARTLHINVTIYRLYNAPAKMKALKNIIKRKKYQ